MSAPAVGRKQGYSASDGVPACADTPEGATKRLEAK